jgi:hypothetical protein
LVSHDADVADGNAPLTTVLARHAVYRPFAEHLNNRKSGPFRIMLMLPMGTRLPTVLTRGGSPRSLQAIRQASLQAIRRASEQSEEHPFSHDAVADENGPLMLLPWKRR